MKKILALLTGLAFLASCQGGDKHELRFNLETGRQYKQVMEANTVISQQIMGQDMTIDMKIEGSMTYLIKGYQNGIYDIEVTYDRLGAVMEMPFMTMEFYSDSDDETDIFSRVMRNMTGKVFNLSMTDKGKVTQITGLDTLFEDMFEDFPEVDAEEIAQIQSQMKESFGPDTFKGNFEMATAIYPEQPVKKGDKWEVNTNIVSTMEMDMNSTYRLKSVKGDHYVISGTSVLSTPEDQSNKFMSEMNFSLNGTMDSEIKVDRESGWIIHAHIKQNVEGSASVAELGGMTIPISMKNDMVMKDI